MWCGVNSCHISMSTFLHKALYYRDQMKYYSCNQITATVLAPTSVPLLPGSVTKGLIVSKIVFAVLLIEYCYAQNLCWSKPQRGFQQAYMMNKPSAQHDLIINVDAFNGDKLSDN